MDTQMAVVKNLMSQGNPERVFDWHRAAELIRNRRPKEACAGLSEDWFWTGGTIYRDGALVPREDTYVFLASKWATPVLNLDGDQIECWVYVQDSPGWNADTYWPADAVEILNQPTPLVS